MAHIQPPPRARTSPTRQRQPLELRHNNTWLDKPLPPPGQTSPGEDSFSPGIRLQCAPASPVRITSRVDSAQEASIAQLGEATPPLTLSYSPAESQDTPRTDSSSHLDNIDVFEDGLSENAPGLRYHHQAYAETPSKPVHPPPQIPQPSFSPGFSPSPSNDGSRLGTPRLLLPRSDSANGPFGELRAGSPARKSPTRFQRGVSASRQSPDSRPLSYIELLNEVPYNQQIAPVPVLNNETLQNAVGTNASLLDTKKTLDMYRANVKKTTDPAISYEFAIFMVNAARDSIATGQGVAATGNTGQEMIKEARDILQKLSDRGYPFAQYYLADGFASGFFNKDKPDNDRAFPLFIAASKHGHAEASYRAALCYEFGWGTAKSYPKATQYLLNAASKGHPGAAARLGKACITNDMGLTGRYREGVKWLKRAQEGADAQYNSGPYELGLLHINGWGDDIFKDEGYAAQLFTQSADLGHAEANFRMGQAYELGLLACPKDAALSVHFYNGAATAGLPEAMMALCAWYMVGAEPVLGRDEGEAYEWAKRAAELGSDKAEYAVAYFTEMGIGCRRDPLEANMWYVRAAEQGNETAKQRLALIRAAASGDTALPPLPAAVPPGRSSPGRWSPKSGKEGGKRRESSPLAMERVNFRRVSPLAQDPIAAVPAAKEKEKDTNQKEKECVVM